MGIVNNTRILLKCFKSGFFSKHRQDVISFSIIGLILIIGWVFFGLFGYIEQNNYYLLLFNTSAVVVGTFGFMVLLYFLKNINFIEREFKEKIILRRRLVNVLKKLENQISVSENFNQYITMMADNIIGLGMWVKQYDYKTNQYKYLFANKIIRNCLPECLPEYAVKSESGSNITPLYNLFSLSDNFTEQDISADLDTDGYFIVDITDKITAKLQKNCIFCEYINGKYYDVLKIPFVDDDNNLFVIAGSAYDVTELMKKKLESKDLADDDMIPIGNTGSFYIPNNVPRKNNQINRIFYS